MSNLLWRFLERVGAQCVTFIVSVVLARLLDPVVYGTVALVTVFTTILQVFVDSGLGNALIQKKDADDTDFSTVFYFNMVVCLLLYGLMYWAAPALALFYERPELTSVIRVIGITVIISGIKNVQQSYVSRNMLFKRFFFATLGGTLLSAAVGIWMAYKGLGVWALVGQLLTNTSIDTVILWITVRWRPKCLFSFVRLKGLFAFGWKLLVANLLNSLYSNLRQLIIGKLYTSEDLAFYNKGSQFPNLIVSNVNTSIDSVLLPTMSREQDDRARVKDMTRRAIKTSSYIMIPMMCGMAIVAEPMVRVLLTEKWIDAVFYIRIFCYVYAFQPIQTANLNAIRALGRSDITLKLEIIKRLIGLAALFATIFISVEAMACSYLVTTLLSMGVNAFPNRNLLNYSVKEQLLDIVPYMAMSVVMMLACAGVGLFGFSDLATLLLQVFVGATVYVVLSAIFRIDSFVYLKDALMTLIRKK